MFKLISFDDKNCTAIVYCNGKVNLSFVDKIKMAVRCLLGKVSNLLVIDKAMMRQLHQVLQHGNVQLIDSPTVRHGFKVGDKVSDRTHMPDLLRWEYADGSSGELDLNTDKNPVIVALLTENEVLVKYHNGNRRVRNIDKIKLER